MRWLLMFMLASCGRVGFGELEQGGALDDGGNRIDDTLTTESDAALTDGGPDPDGSTGTGACTPPSVGCAFDGATPCSCWGMANTIFAAMNESGGAVTIVPQANQAGAQGSCMRTAVPFGAAGAIVEISQVVQGAQGLTAFSVGSSPDIFEVSIRNGQINTTDGSNTGTAGYDPVAMRWFRIRPNPTAVGTIIESAPDGKTWTMRAGYGRVASASYSIRLIGGTIGATAAPGSARFESVNICPP